jgi:DNA-binding SARP family transcriptional activator/TolB-like protein/Tfp pilus assembly protein PilF
MRLETLGAVDLTGDGDRETRSLLSQPKRVALLAYLALAGASGYRRRDKLVALFWPELDAAHARGALRQALTFLRRTLGDGVVITRGDEEIGVDRSLLSCDALEFIGEFEAGNHDRAMALYRGDFLDGFFVSDAAVELQSWIESERAELRQHAARCAWALAAQQRDRGDRVGAGRWARKAAGLAAEDESESARLIAFLDEIGDRAGAMATYQELSDRLQREFESEPAPETQELIRRVRGRAAAEGTGAFAPAPIVPAAALAEEEPKSVRRRPLFYVAGAGAILIVGYFAAFTWRQPAMIEPSSMVAVLPIEEGGADTTRRYVTDELTDRLITALAQNGVQVISAGTMRSYRDSALSPADIAQRVRADAVVSGLLESDSGRSALTVRVIRSGDQRPRWQQTFRSANGDALALSQTAAHEISRRLLGSAAAGKQAAVVTRPLSAEAIDLYARGRQLWNKRGRANLLAALDYFSKALDAEPRFALAASGMADAYVQLGYASLLRPDDAFPKAEKAARTALQLDSTLAEPHAALAFVHFYYRWDWEAAEREFVRALELNPSYATAREWYGLYLTAMGRYVEALAQERRAQALDPLSAAIAGTAGWVLHYSGRNDEAARELETALRMHPSFALGQLYLGRVEQARERLDSALAHYAATGPLRTWVPTIAAEGYVLGMQGRKRDAEATLARMNSLADHEYVTSYAVALVHAALGRRDSAFTWLERGVRERTHWLVWLNRDTRWTIVRDDPRFATLVREVGLPP